MTIYRAKNALLTLLLTLSVCGAEQRPKSPPPVIKHVKIEKDEYHQIWVVITYDNGNQYTCTGYFQSGKTNYLGFGAYAGENTLLSISDEWSKNFFHIGINDLDKSEDPQRKNIATIMRKQLEKAHTTTGMDLLS